MKFLAAGILRLPDYIVLTAYFVLMLGIGAYFYRLMRGLKDYFSGGNRIPWWLSGVSYYMSSFSAFAFISYSAIAYKYGWVGITLFWVSVPATTMSVILFATRWRRARINSPIEYLETRYSPAVRQLFAWHGIPVRLIDDALKLVAIGTFLSVGVGLKLQTSMLLSGLIMVAYTFMGGLWAVAVTDFVQFIILTAAILVVLPLSIKAAGGLSHIVQHSPPGFFHLTSPEFNWVYIGCNILLYLLANAALHWSLVQRYYCVPTEKDARKVGWLVVFLNFIWPPVMFFPAIAARHFLPHLVDEKQVYPLLCAHLLPTGILGLVIAAMFSATMSMLSGDFNACANVLTLDVYQRLIHPKATQKELVYAGRLATLIFGLGSIGLALFLTKGNGEQLFRNMVTLFSTTTAPVAIPMLLGLTSRRTNTVGALAGFFLGIGVGLFTLWRLWETPKLTLHGVHMSRENLILIVTTVTTLVPIVLLSLMTGMRGEERQRVDGFLARLSRPIGPEDNVGANDSDSFSSAALIVDSASSDPVVNEGAR